MRTRGNLSYLKGRFGLAVKTEDGNLFQFSANGFTLLYVLNDMNRLFWQILKTRKLLNFDFAGKDVLKRRIHHALTMPLLLKPKAFALI